MVVTAVRVESTVEAQGSKVLVVADFEVLSFDGYSLRGEKDVLEKSV